jgi:hypothetical protein
VPLLASFANELVKVAISPIVKDMARDSLLGMAFESAFNRDATPFGVVREGIGFGIGDVGATAVARGLGFGRLGRFAAGMVGGNALASALRRRFAEKPVQHALDKLPDTAEFKAIKQAAARMSVLTPQSSNVSGYSYDPTTKSLNVTYKGGGTYMYKGVEANAVRRIKRNKSVGKTINKLRQGLEYEKIGKMTAFGEDHYDESEDAGWKDKLPGGLADKKTPADFDPAALSKGIKVELEHVDDRALAMEIAMDHLTEDKSYYDKLEKIEKKAAPRSVMEEVMEALRIRAMRGRHVRDVKVLPIGRATPPPIPRRGNVLKPVSGEIVKKSDIIKESMLRERIREGAPSIVDSMAQRRRSMMKAAGVAKKQISFDGLALKVEHEPGDTRTGKSKDGKTWSRKMSASYGYVPGTKGMAEDGDAIDFYLAKDPVPGSDVYAVRQNKKDGSFDETKNMLGYPSEAAAKADYLKHMPEWAFGSMKAESWDSFKSKCGKKAA